MRRKLREAKLQGQRIGNQWFVEERPLVSRGREFRPLVPPELLAEIDRTREAIFKRNGIMFDAVALVNEVREEDFGEK